MERRRLLGLLAASAAAIGLSPRQAAALLRARAPRTPTLAFFTADQRAAVTALADRMIPDTDTPGAVGAGVVDYAEMIVAEWLNDAERERFMRGLAHLDAHADAVAGVRFAQSGDARQIAILKGMEAEGLALQDLDPDAPASFFHQARALVLHGYYTSEVGMREELLYQPIPGRFDGCADVAEVTRPAPAGER